MSEPPSSYRLSNIPSCGQTPFCFILSSISERLGVVSTWPSSYCLQKQVQLGLLEAFGFLPSAFIPCHSLAWPFPGLSGVPLASLLQLWGWELCCLDGVLPECVLVISVAHRAFCEGYACWSSSLRGVSPTSRPALASFPPFWVGGLMLQAHRLCISNGPVQIQFLCLLAPWPWVHDFTPCLVVARMTGNVAAKLSAWNIEQRQRWINGSYYYIKFVSFPLLNLITFDFRFAEAPNWLRNWLKTLLFNTLGFNLLSWHYHLLLDFMELNLLDQIIWSSFDGNTFYTLYVFMLFPLDFLLKVGFSHHSVGSYKLL